MSRTALAKRVRRIQKATTQPIQYPTVSPLLPADEGADVAQELAAAFGRLVQTYREAYSLTPEEARARAREAPALKLEQILTCPPSEVGWADLEALAEQDPALAHQRWEQVKDSARGELANGHRAARTVDTHHSTCWERARFLAVRAALVDAWNPRNGLELLLIDQAAIYQHLLSQQLETSSTYATLDALGARRELTGNDSHSSRRLPAIEAHDRAVELAERLQGLFLGVLKTLQGLRRTASPVVVRGARQVNIGQTQVNVSQ